MDGLINKHGGLYFGKVIDNRDELGGGRIKVAVYPADKRKAIADIPYAFPAIPKLIHIVPKIGELVIVISEDFNRPDSQRFYIGPLISQLQYIFKEGSLNATSLLKGGVMPALPSPEERASMHGTFPNTDEIAILGRKNSDIILSDDDLRIRCGARLIDEHDPEKLSFNKESPAYIKLKYYPNKLKDEVESTATIVADKINLISNNGSPVFNVSDTDEGIPDEEMKKLIERSHKLPYGDVLVNFLSLFLKMFKSHTHKYHNMPPCPDVNSGIFDRQYGSDEKNLDKLLLSENIRIN